MNDDIVQKLEWNGAQAGLRVANGRPVTLADARVLLDDPPAFMRDSVKRKIAKFTTAYEKQVRDRQIAGVQKAAEQMREQQAGIRTRLEEADKRISALTKGVRAGRIDPHEAEREVKRIIQTIHQDRAALDQIDESIERVLQVADQDPAEWQIEVAKRFPNLADSLPILTEAWLLGADDNDPLG